MRERESPIADARPPRPREEPHRGARRRHLRSGDDAARARHQVARRISRSTRPAGLVEYLATLEHSFAMYAISFVVLAIFWIAHHILFHYVRHVDRRLLWINMAFLLLVTFVPFSTDLLGDHGHLALPVVVYGIESHHARRAPCAAAPLPAGESAAGGGRLHAHHGRAHVSRGQALRAGSGGVDGHVDLQPARRHVLLPAARHPHFRPRAVSIACCTREPGAAQPPSSEDP